MTTCTYDTGSMYGCVPACDREAVSTLTYWNGSYGPFASHLCPVHVGPMVARVYPDSYRLDTLS